MLPGAVWCAVLLLGSAPASALARPPAPDPRALRTAPAQHLQDQDILGLVYGGAGRGWPDALDPALYFAEDLPRFPRYDAGRPKRKMPSLSISNPMEVLRQRLVLEIARKQLRENTARQAEENRLFLQNVGKRGMWAEGVLNAARDDDD